MQHQYVSTSQLCERYGRSSRTIYRWQRTIGFPKPLIPGGNGSESRWRESDIQAWEEKRMDDG
ncbi:helix-turn-helix transcriptional regulator [Halomonas campaniensis]|uniref:helix-turn-helix transcriptional regulator n=1 Tax=Halomonas campaniensis TaxID=213554 RepID=UPI003D358CC2